LGPGQPGRRGARADGEAALRGHRAKRSSGGALRRWRIGATRIRPADLSRPPNEVAPITHSPGKRSAPGNARRWRAALAKQRCEAIAASEAALERCAAGG